MQHIVLLTLLTVLSACDGSGTEQPAAAASGFGPDQLAIVINDDDPLSRRIGEYYVVRRRLPAANVIHVRFTPGNTVMSPQQFRTLKARVDAATPRRVQAYALAWTVPYRVGCMSVTTAFAAGFDAGFCAATCKTTTTSPYFDSDSRRPYDDFGWRPSMLLAGSDFEQVKALIDRGTRADASQPHGTAYLLNSSDPQRNVRARFYPGIRWLQSDRFRIQVLDTDTLAYRSDVLFYFTGLQQVDALETNRFLPGAIADHLTSAGGMLTDSDQMSSLRWLQAGATGSYGTVSEPCNFIDKFPRPNIVIERYLDGETLLESYWKSVAAPGQGVFIGEPLAHPFGS